MSNRLEFNEKPYDKNYRFAVYTPKQLDNILELIEKESTKKLDYVWESQQKPKKLQTEPALQDDQKKSGFKDKLVQQVESTRTPEKEYAPKSNLLQKLAENQILNGLSSSMYCKTESKEAQLILQQKNMEKLRSSLYFDEKTRSVPKTTLKNKIVEKIVQDSEIFLNKPMLMQSVFKLKSLNLLKDSDIHVKRHNHNDKFNFVYNDFHSKSTNPGYSRNDKGGFFTR